MLATLYCAFYLRCYAKKTQKTQRITYFYGMGKRKAILLGATGLIGSEILKLLMKDQYFDEVLLLNRRKLEINSPKVKQRLVDFSKPETYYTLFDSYDTVFCAVGTTRKKTPDLNAYRKVDYDIPYNAILCAEKSGVESFMLVSSIGADPKSKNFYLKIKGEVEAALIASKITNKGIFRPSLLLGKRKEKRFAESLAQRLMPFFNFLLPKNYRAIHATDVAKSMVNASLKKQGKEEVFSYQAMMNLVKEM